MIWMVHRHCCSRSSTSSARSHGSDRGGSTRSGSRRCLGNGQFVIMRMMILCFARSSRRWRNNVILVARQVKLNHWLLLLWRGLLFGKTIGSSSRVAVVRGSSARCASRTRTTTQSLRRCSSGRRGSASCSSRSRRSSLFWKRPIPPPPVVEVDALS